MQLIDAAALRALLSMDELLDAVEGAFRDVALGRDRSPLRTAVAIQGGTLLLMPGVRDGGAGSTVKLVTVMDANPARGLPTVQAVVAWFDGHTGAPEFLLDGPTLTAMRTGAASGVATRLLARPDSKVLAMLGAGAQAEWQVRAVAAARPINEVRIHAPSPTRREALAASLREGLALDCRAVAGAEEAVRGADVVCCATTSTTPVFDAAWVSPGTHVNGIGAFRLEMVELPPALFGRASRVAVDAVAAVEAEAGDLMAAVAAGAMARDGYLEIGSVPREWAATRDREAITIFKSVGLAIQDLAAAEVVVRRWRDRPVSDR